MYIFYFCSSIALAAVGILCVFCWKWMHEPAEREYTELDVVPPAQDTTLGEPALGIGAMACVHGTLADDIRRALAPRTPTAFPIRDVRVALGYAPGDALFDYSGYNDAA